MNQENGIEFAKISEQLDMLINESNLEMASWNEVTLEDIEKSCSNLDGWDYCFSIAVGLISPFISTNEELQDYLKEIHNAASEATGDYDFLQKLLGMLLHHKGDPIDQINRKFIKRDKNNAYVLFHRLLWGHDILSIKDDNPFYLMVKKQGFSGIIQAVQHLLADTTSKQGLPFPGSSYLDFKDENGNLSNYLISISQELSIETTGCKRAAQEIYSHLFTIRASDKLGESSNNVFNNVYFKLRDISDDVRRQQFCLISYSISFWAQTIIGIGMRGAPACNFPVGMAMIKSFASLYNDSRSKTKSLVKSSQQLELETNHLIAVADEDFASQNTLTDENDLKEVYQRGYRNSITLMNLWEESYD